MIRAWPESGRRSGALWERRENVVAFAVNLAVVVLVGLCPISGSCSFSIRDATGDAFGQSRRTLKAIARPGFEQLTDQPRSVAVARQR